MKRTLILSLQAAAVILLTAACQADLLTEQDASLIPDPTAPIELSGSAPIETTANGVVTRADNDQLGFTLYAVPSNSGSWPGTPYINGVSATLASGSGTARSISFSPTAYWPVGGQELKFIGVMNTGGTKITVNSNGIITLNAGTGTDKDILLSNKLTGHKVKSKGEFTSNPKYMQFSRLMARLIVKPGTENKQVVTCNINGGNSSATYDVLTGNISKSSTYSISYNTNNSSQTYYLIPGTTISQLTNITAGGISKGVINLTNSGGTNTSFTTAAGKSYTIEVTAKGATLVSSGLSIDNTWKDGGNL